MTSRFNIASVRDTSLISFSLTSPTASCKHTQLSDGLLLELFNWQSRCLICDKTRGFGRWEAARYGAVLALEYVRAVLGLSRSVQGGKRSLRHLPNIKLIGQQAAKLWGFFASNAISRRDLDLWPLDLEIGPRGAGVPGTLPTKFSIRRPFRFPSRWRHGTDRQTDGRTGSTHDGASF